jgi:hypothetical protein
MASKIIVDQLEKTGGLLTPLTLPSVNATTGQYMQNDGSGGLSWVAAPTDTQGVTHASQWRLTADFTNTAVPIQLNLAEVNAPVGFGVLGSSMTLSSGKFTFPSTGYWLITFCTVFHCGTTSVDNQSAIQTCIDHTAGPTFVNAAWGSESGQGSQLGTQSISYIFDVTNTAECKCQFTIPYVSTTTNVTTKGDTAFNETCMTFIKLGDTP